ncbi:MAG: ribosomal protein S18-alanine N-acetyltransferase [Oscillospiraceae bacterium]|nr:ribosomal protein S18-alanine N-acetyltransferase [Oscillospiraceae bacterium]
MIEIISCNRYNPSYAEQMYEIERACFSDPWSRSAFENLNGFVVYVADRGDSAHIFAYIILTHVLDEGQIINIAVHPDYRRMGIANALIEKVLEYSRVNGIKLLMLEVRESNAAAIKLYEKFGFREVGRRKRYYKNPIEDALLMDMEVKC